MDPNPPLKSTVAERIDAALGIAPEPQPSNIVKRPAQIVSSGNEDTDFDTDFDIARGIIHHTAETLSDLSDTATYIAKERQDPRSIEAATMAAKEARDTALSILDLHQKKANRNNTGKKVTGDKFTQNNAVFVGTTGELLKLTRDMNLGVGLNTALNTINVEPINTTATHED